MTNVTAKLSFFRRAKDGSTAIEFAFLAPVFLAMLFGIIVFSYYLSVMNGVQQLVADAARASIAGLTDSERYTLAQNIVTAGASSYPFIDQTKLTIATSTSGTALKVSLSYDMSSSVILHVAPWLPLPSSTITRSAVVQLGVF